MSRNHTAIGAREIGSGLFQAITRCCLSSALGVNVTIIPLLIEKMIRTSIHFESNWQRTD